MSFRVLLAGLATLAGSLLPAVAVAEINFPTNSFSVEQTELRPDTGIDLDGLNGQLSLAVAENVWIRLGRETLNPADGPSGDWPEWRYSTVMIGVGGMITDQGMWYLETGGSEVHRKGGASERSGAFALGIRTQISPRFELGGGPRFGAVHRLQPGEDDALMRVHGNFRLFEGLALSGSYDYNDDYRQWRLGLRLAW